jgi:hypothetical protein
LFHYSLTVFESPCRFHLFSPLSRRAVRLSNLTTNLYRFYIDCKKKMIKIKNIFLFLVF